MNTVEPLYIPPPPPPPPRERATPGHPYRDLPWRAPIGVGR